MHITLLCYTEYLTHQNLNLDNLYYFMQLSKYFTEKRTLFSARIRNSDFKALPLFCKVPCSEWRGYLTTPAKAMSTTIFKNFNIFLTFFVLFLQIHKHPAQSWMFLGFFIKLTIKFLLFSKNFPQKTMLIIYLVLYYNKMYFI